MFTGGACRVQNTTDRRKTFIINVLYFALAGALIYLGLRYALRLVLPFFIGLIVALILKPAVNLISRAIRIPRKLTALILALLFYMVVGGLLVLMGIKLVNYIRSIVINAPAIYAAYLQPSLAQLFEGLEDLSARFDPSLAAYVEKATESLTRSLSELATGLSSGVIRSVSNTVFTIPNILLTILLSIISTVYFAMDFELIGEYARRFLPERILLFLVQLRNILVRTVLKYIKSYLILLVITFIELTAGFLIMGIDYAVGLAALVAIIDILPVLGTGIVLIPWLLIDVILGNYGLAISLLVLYVVITVVRNILEPKIIGEQIGVHPLLTLLCMYVGLRLFGVVGIFALPLILVVFKGFRESGFFDRAPAAASQGAGAAESLAGEAAGSAADEAAGQPAGGEPPEASRETPPSPPEEEAAVRKE